MQVYRMNKSLFDLTGTTALVTGCNKGIGKGMAFGLAEAGANIIGVSATMPLQGSDVGNGITQLGRNFKAYQSDFSDRQNLYGFIEKVLRENDVIDILINNAGKQMLRRGRGKIIFTASLLSFQGGITVPGYAASKGAIASLVKAFANEWAAKGVNVNAIAPGYVATDNTEALRNDVERSASIISRIPAGRWGQPDDFKGAVVFLASAASDYVHGTILTVDGGWMGR